MELDFIIFSWLFFATMSGIIATLKKRNGAVWFFSGLLFGIFAVIAALFVPQKVSRPSSVQVMKNIEEQPDVL